MNYKSPLRSPIAPTYSLNSRFILFKILTNRISSVSEFIFILSSSDFFILRIIICNEGQMSLKRKLLKMYSYTFQHRVVCDWILKLIMLKLMDQRKIVWILISHVHYYTNSTNIGRYRSSLENNNYKLT